VISKLKFIGEFLKFNIVSLIATSVDFIVFVVLTNGMNLYYLSATVIGAICGGITAFALNRNWVFARQEGIINSQILHFFLVWLGSIVLNALGIYLLVEFIIIDEVLSKIITSIIVGILFNFTMNKYYVFK